MGIEFLWTLATASPVDARRGEWRPADRPWARAVDADSRERQINRYDYLAQVARAADLTGFDGLLIPDDPDGEEPWIVTGTLLRDAPRLRLVTTIVPGSTTAVYAAKMAASVQRFSHGRQAWAIDLSGGDTDTDADREVRARELIDIARGVWGDVPFTREGRFFMVEDGELGGLVRDVAAPALYFHGDDPATLRLSATYGDAHLFDHGPPDTLRRQADALRAQIVGGAAGPRIGLSIPLLARETEADVSTERVRRDLPAHALVGTYDAVADTIAAYVEAGFTLFAFSGDGQIGEVHIAGEQIVARVRRRLSPFMQNVA